MAVLLKEFYRNTIVNKLMNEYQYTSVMQVPRLLKITLNMGLGEAVADKKLLEGALSDLQKISGQKPVLTLARKSEAGFKIREDWPIGCKVTLRNDMMYHFLKRLIDVYIPRIRDFRGFSPKAFDGRGNYNLGIQEQSICPEIEYEKMERVRGFDIAMTTSAKNDAEALSLLKAFNFPLKSDEGV